MESDLVNDFQKWMDDHSFCLHEKLFIDYKKSSHYGLITKDFINKGEVLFEIPRNCLLSVENSTLNKIIPLDNLNGSKWSKLILCILHELHIKDDSFWKSYLRLFPNFSHMELPLFWNEEKLKYLQKTGVLDLINNDIKSINDDYNNCVLPFIKAHPELFDKKIDINDYKKYAAFVMAYSFSESIQNDEDESEDEENSTSEGSCPSMVPMADVLNHISENNARLTYHPDKLVMSAIKDIESGGEVWNTYGDLPNTMLLHMYGFTLNHEDNKDDTIEINISDWKWSGVSQDRLEKIKKFRSDLMLIVLDKSGFMNALDSAQLLNYLHMGQEDFKNLESNICEGGDNWEEISEDVEQYSDWMENFDHLNNLPSNWLISLKSLLLEVMEFKEKKLSELECMTNVDETQNSPQLFIRRLLTSHLIIIKNFMNFLT